MLGELFYVVYVVDLYMGGELIWVVIDGGLDLGDGLFLVCCELFCWEYDLFCLVVVNELCGFDVWVGVLLVEF